MKPDGAVLRLLVGSVTLLAAACGGDIETLQSPGPQAPWDPSGDQPLAPYGSDSGVPPSAPPGAPPGAPAAPSCRAEETPFEGACYSAPGIKWMTFDSATKVCAARDAQVASITSPAVNELVFGLLAPLNQKAWIGLRRELFFAWSWVDGQPMGLGDYQNWAPGEPNNETGAEDCVVMWGPNLKSHPEWRGRWNDLDCDGKVDTVICRRVP